MRSLFRIPINDSPLIYSIYPYFTGSMYNFMVIE